MRILIAIVFTLATIRTMAQSPWVAGKGKGFAQVGFTTIGPYGNLFTSDGSDFPLRNEITDRTIQLFGEFGITESTSVIASVPLKSLEAGKQLIPSLPMNSGSFSTLGNIQIAARHNFVNKGIVFSGQVLAELPSTGYDERTGLRGGLDALSIVPSLSVGKGLSNFYAYLSGGVAIRSNNYSSDFRLGGEAGYKVINRVYIVGVLDVVENFENGNVVEPTAQRETGLYLNNQSFFAYGIKAIIGFTDNLGISGAYYGASSGNLVAKSPSLNFGVYYKW